MSHLTDGISAVSQQPVHDTCVVAAVVAAARVAASICDAHPPVSDAHQPGDGSDSVWLTVPQR